MCTIQTLLTSVCVCVCACLHVEVSVVIARLVSQFTTKTAVDILILGFFCLQMTKKILQNEAKIHSSGLFCNLHLLVCDLASTGDTAADDMTSVTFTNKSLGTVRKQRHIFFPDKL